VLFHTFQHFLQVRNTGADHDIIVVNGVTLNVFIFFNLFIAHKKSLIVCSKFERFFMPSLIVFGLLAFGGFLIIYSITQDMTKLAQSMDPNMGKNMSSVDLTHIFRNIIQTV
jgi:hypothetical protein